MSKKILLLQYGDVIKLTAEHTVYAQVPKHFVYSNHVGDFSLTKERVKLEGDFDYLQGTYVVTKTQYTGGGTGHGRYDIYLDGWEVTCVNIDDNTINVSFYQTGSFTAMIEDIKPIGKAKLKWVYE